MNKNLRTLLDLLLQQEDYLTAKQIAEMLGVTERSIRNYVKTLNSSTNQGPLILSSSKGYKIQKSIYNESIKNRLFDKTDSVLLFRIVLILIKQESYISFDDLAISLHYSIERIRSKVQLLFSKIKELKIKAKLDSQIFTGIRIVGDEDQKRLLLEQFVPIESIEKKLLIDTTYKALSKICTKEEIKIQVRIIDEVFSKYHANMEFVVYVKIITHILIAVYRRSEGWEISHNESNNVDVNYAEYDMASDIISRQKKDKYSKAEIIALTNYLISLPINLPEIHTINLNKSQLCSVEKTLKSAEKYYSIPLYSNHQYRAQVTNHIMRLLNPLSESIPIFNPYSKETKREYLFAYSIACFIYDELEKYFDIIIPESEIAYLAIHVQLVLTEEAKRPIETLLIYQGKNTEAELFKYKIQTFFPTIKIKEINYEISEKKLVTYPLVLLRGFNELVFNNSNMLHVSRNINAEDLNKIQNFVDAIGTSSLIRDLDYYHIDEVTSVDAIETLITSSGYKNLLPYFKQRESMSSTDIGNKVAMPHPFLMGSETSAKVIIGINDHDIPWGNQKVRLIIIFIPAADLKTNKSLFNEVYQRTNNLIFVQKLLKTHTKSEFISVWNKKGDNNNAI